MNSEIETIVSSNGETFQVLTPPGPPPIVVIQEPDFQLSTNNSVAMKLSYDEIVLRIGTHVSRLDSKQTLSQCLTQFSVHCATNGNVPCQMFLRNPHRGNDAITEEDFELARHVIEANSLRYYTHGAYIINLSKPTTKKNPNSDKWIMSLLIKDLQNTQRIRGRGVVVHVGKHLQMDPREATDKMEHYLRQALDYATEECPLLLETAAGQGTELCVAIEELSSLYSRFNGDEHRRFKICVDTCHVFSAGYDPLDFLVGWHQLHPNSIGLVHFNDSEREKGARVDRHSLYLKGGHIGFERLMEVAQWCLDHDIDMVTE